MDCPYFVHIDVAPKPGTVTESVLENTIIVIATTDGSHSPIRTKLYDLARFPLKNLTDNMVYLSHGMSRNEFMNTLMNRQGVNEETEMALYYYKQLNASY